MLFLLLALAWWPFHHKTAAPVGVDTPLGRIHFPDSYCPHTVDGYFFVGPDGLIGVSTESCDAAFSDWNKNTGDPPVLART